MPSLRAPHRNPDQTAMVVVALTSGGGLDAGFGNGGIAKYVINGVSERIHAMDVQADGRIVVAGDTYHPATLSMQIAAMRLKPDGGVDTSFGNGGAATTQPPNLHPQVRALALLEGVVVVAGMTLGATPFAPLPQAFAVRYNEDGQLDASFANNGVLLTPFGLYSEAHAVAALADGGVLLAGRCASSFCLIRLDKFGSLDPNYGNGGYA